MKHPVFNCVPFFFIIFFFLLLLWIWFLLLLLLMLLLLLSVTSVCSSIPLFLFFLPCTLEHTLGIGDTICDILAQQDHNLAPPPQFSVNSVWTASAAINHFSLSHKSAPVALGVNPFTIPPYLLHSLAWWHKQPRQPSINFYFSYPQSTEGDGQMSPSAQGGNLGDASLSFYSLFP